MRSITFDTEGWRAKIDEDFTDDSVARIADAVGAYWSDLYPGSCVLVGYDTRRGAREFAETAAQILATYGLITKLSDRPCPLPALSFNIANDTRACGGLMITASSAPAEYEGICLRGPMGSVLPSEALQDIEALIPAEPPRVRGQIEISDFLTSYLADIESRVDCDLIRSARLKVVVDPMFGPARDIWAELLATIGVDVIEIHGDDCTDFYGNHPKPSEPWIDECERATVNLGCDVGFILDGDADRLGVVDNSGHFVNPHRLPALLIQHLVENKHQTGRVVMPLNGSTYIRREAKYEGLPLTVTPIGFGWSSLEMRRGDVLLACDTEGGIALPSHLFERDGIMTSLLVLELMATTKMSISDLVKSLDQRCGALAYGSREVRLDVAEVQIIKNLLPGMNPQTFAERMPIDVSHGDGLRLKFDDGAWVLMRPSRYHSSIRLYAEATSPKQRDELLSAGGSWMKNKLI